MTIVRLGQGVDATGAFAPEALERVFAASDELRRRDPGGRCRADAVRGDLGGSGREQPGRVLRRNRASGSAWSRRSSRAPRRPSSASAAQPADSLALLPGPYLVADIGGGSTELVLGDADGVIAAESLDIGSVRLTERHVTSDPTTPDELAAITKDVDALLDTDHRPARRRPAR